MKEIVLLVNIFMTCLASITLYSLIYDGKLKRDNFNKVLILLGISSIGITGAMLSPNYDASYAIIFRPIGILATYFSCRIYFKGNSFRHFITLNSIAFFFIPIEFIMVSLFIDFSLISAQIMSTLVNVLIMTIIIYIMNKYKEGLLILRFRFLISKMYLLGLLPLLIDSIFFISIFMDKVPSVINSMYIMYSFTIACIFLILMISLIRENKNSKEIQSQADMLSLYTNTIEYLYEDIRIYKHDINNILLSLKYYIDEKDYESVNKIFYNDIYGVDAFDIKVYKLLAQIQNLKIDVLKGLILAKYQKAISAGVSFDIGVQCQVGEVDISDTDLCRVIGIYLDNAIEAASETDEKQLLMYIDKVDDSYLIKISNTYNIENTLVLPQKNHSSKGSGRGLGLFSADKIIKRNKHIRKETKLEENYYSQYVYLSI